MENKEKLKTSVKKAGNSLWRMFPILLGTILLVSLVNALIPNDFFREVFTGSVFLDSFISAGVGSILAGSPIVSYILGGELLSQGIGLISVTAFIVAWITVGVVHIPAESAILGKRFTLIRNTITFFLAILSGLLIFVILNLFDLPFS